MAKTVDIGTALQNVVNNPTTEAELLGALVNDLDIVQDVKLIRNLRTARTLPKYTASKGWRPVDTKIENAISRGSWGTRKIEPKTGMKILEMIPEDYRESWLSDMLDVNADEIPFAKFIWNEEFKRMLAEVNDTLWLSKALGNTDDFDAGDTYTAGEHVVFGIDRLIYECVTNTTAGQSPATHPAKWKDVTDHAVAEGPGTIIEEEIAGGFNPVLTGATTDSNMLDKIEMMYKDMTPTMRKAGGVFIMSHDEYFKYLAHEKDVYPTVANQDMGDGLKYVYGSGKKWSINPRSYMGTSERLVAYVTGNLYMGTNQLEDGNKIGKLVQTVHGYKAIVKMMLSFQFADTDMPRVNDRR